MSLFLLFAFSFFLFSFIFAYARCTGKRCQGGMRYSYLFSFLFDYLLCHHIFSASQITAGKATGYPGSENPWNELHGVGSATFDVYHIPWLEELIRLLLNYTT